MLSSFEQHIYNEHLKISRSASGKPYRLRKSFDDIDSTIEVHLKRVARILNKFDNISLTDFLQAPYAVYGEEYFDLKFFTTQRALKAYSIYMQREADTNPDTTAIIQRVVKSLYNLKSFCLSQNITLQSYTSHTTGDLPTFVLHLKERKLSYYVMLELPGAFQLLKKQDSSVMKFMFGESFHTDLNLYKSRYFNSTTCKSLVREGLKKIQKSIESTTQII